MLQDDSRFVLHVEQGGQIEIFCCAGKAVQRALRGFMGLMFVSQAISPQTIQRLQSIQARPWSSVTPLWLKRVQ